MHVSILPSVHASLDPWLVALALGWPHKKSSGKVLQGSAFSLSLSLFLNIEEEGGKDVI